MYLFLYHVIGYRKKVVRRNLRNAFPNKTHTDLAKIERKFYQHLCDVIVENIWSISASKKQMQKHLRFFNLDEIREAYHQSSDLIFLSGHTGNWEWGSLSFCTLGLHQPWAIYRPVKNEYFNRFLIDNRSRFGARLIPMQQVYRSINERHEQPFALTFIADQSPVPEYAYWTQFLNQDTGFFNGFEKIAFKKNLPVYFAHFKKLKRGYYEVRFDLVSKQPALLKENELTELFANHLEKLIHEAPEHWLWSHRRWKHKRPL